MSDQTIKIEMILDVQNVIKNSQEATKNIESLKAQFSSIINSAKAQAPELSKVPGAMNSAVRQTKAELDNLMAALKAYEIYLRRVNSLPKDVSGKPTKTIAPFDFGKFGVTRQEIENLQAKLQEAGITATQFGQMYKQAFSEVGKDTKKATDDIEKELKRQEQAQDAWKNRWQNRLREALGMKVPQMPTSFLNNFTVQTEEATKSTRGFMGSITSLGGVVRTVFAGALGFTAVSAIRDFIGWMGRGTQAAIEFERSMYLMEVSVRALQRAGMDTTIAQWTELLKKLKTQFPIFTEQELVSGVQVATLKMREYEFTLEEINQLIEVSAVIARATGRDFGETAERITGAITRGYYEALQTIGIPLSRIRVMQEAYNQGIEGSFGMLDEATRAHISYKIVLEDIAAIEEDLGNVSGLAFDKVRIAQADVTDAQKELGKAFMDLKAEWLTGLASIVKSLTLIPAQIEIIGVKLNTWRQNAVIGFKLIGSIATEVFTGIWKSINKLNDEELLSSIVASFQYVFKIIEIGAKSLYATIKQQQLQLKEAINPLADLSQEKEELASLWDEVNALTEEAKKLKEEGKIDFSVGVVDNVKQAAKEAIAEVDRLKAEAAVKTIDIYVKYHLPQDDILTQAYKDLLISPGAKDYLAYIRDYQQGVNTYLGDLEPAKQGIKDYGQTVKDVITKLKDAWLAFNSSLEDLDVQLNIDINTAGIDYQAELDKIEQDLAQSIADAWSDYYDSLRKLDEDYQQYLSQSQEDHRVEELRAEEEHLKDMRRLREDYLYDLEDALKERDAIAIIRLTREYNKEKKRREEDYADQKRQRDEDYARQRAEREEEYRRRREELKYELEQRLRLLQIEAQQRRDEAYKAYQKELADLQAKYEKEKELQAQALQDKFNAIMEDLIKTQELTQADLDAMDALIRQKYSPDSEIYKLWDAYRKYAYDANLEAIKYTSMFMDILGQAALNAQQIIMGLLNGILSLGQALNWASGGNPYQYAEGGRYPVKTPVLVGEKGPELVVFDNPGEIIPADVTARLMKDMTVHNSVDFSGEPDMSATINRNDSRNYNTNISGNLSREDKVKIDVWLSPDLEGRIIDKTLDEAAGVVVDIVNRRR